eukprot:7179644-Pyramimonas_sp.AAC.1
MRGALLQGAALLANTSRCSKTISAPLFAASSSALRYAGSDSRVDSWAPRAVSWAPRADVNPVRCSSSTAAASSAKEPRERME